MGRCQGGFCMDKVAKIIAKENKNNDDVKVEDNISSVKTIADLKNNSFLSLIRRK